MLYSQEIIFDNASRADDHTKAIDAAVEYLQEKFGAKILDLKWASRTNGYRFDIVASVDNDGNKSLDQKCFVFVNVFIRHDGTFPEDKNKEKKRSAVEPAADEWLGYTDAPKRFDEIIISVGNDGKHAVLRHRLGYL